MTNDERNSNDEARNAKEIPGSNPEGPRVRRGCSISHLRQMAQKMRCSSLASFQMTRASSFKLGSEVAIMRRKNLVSRASLRHVPILFLKSFRETPSSASQ